MGEILAHVPPVYEPGQTWINYLEVIDLLHRERVRVLPSRPPEMLAGGSLYDPDSSLGRCDFSVRLIGARVLDHRHGDRPARAFGFSSLPVGAPDGSPGLVPHIIWIQDEGSADLIRRAIEDTVPPAYGEGYMRIFDPDQGDLVSKTIRDVLQAAVALRRR
jgi:hypothetical protein